MEDAEISFARARAENDARLLDQLEQLRAANDLQILDSFARAYLGLFYEIDKNLPPAQRLALLASDQVVEAVLQGFVAVLLRTDLPGPQEIGEALGKSEILPSGYVILAGMHQLYTTDADAFSRLPVATRQSALCFHYANATGHRDRWLDELLCDSEISIPALRAFWAALIRANVGMLPGLRQILTDPAMQALRPRLVLVVLRDWPQCKLKTFIELVFAALRHARRDELLDCVRDMVAMPDDAPGAFKADSKRIYWLALGLLLSPEEFAQPLANYIGRVKQKALPLLDFVMRVSDPAQQVEIELSPAIYARLLRIVAPIFPPQEHAYGHMGGIDVNSRNVMRLFHKLATHPAADAPEAIKWLRKARVMKIYAAVLEHAGQLQQQLKRQADFSPPDFTAYLQALEQDGKLVARQNRFDSNH